MKRRVICDIAVICLLAHASVAFADNRQPQERVILVAYHSVPEGAEIIDKNGTIGVTPFVTAYDATSAYLAGKCEGIQSLLIVWLTGPHTIKRDQRLCPQNGLNEQVVTFTIPAGESDQYIEAFARSPEIVNAIRQIEGFMQGGKSWAPIPDNATLVRDYQQAAAEAHEDLGRRIAVGQARLDALNGAIQAQQYEAAMDSVVRAQQNEVLLNEATGAAGRAVGCAAAGGCLPPYSTPPSYPATPKIKLPAAAQPFSAPAVTCRLGPMGTSATCH